MSNQSKHLITIKHIVAFLYVSYLIFLAGFLIHIKISYIDLYHHGHRKLKLILIIIFAILFILYFVLDFFQSYIERKNK